MRADRFAASARAGVESRRTLAEKALTQWNQEPYPTSVEKLERLAAAPKAGGYRSASSYIGQYRADAERQGHEMSGPMLRTIKDMNRSCDRGIGPAVKSMALPMSRLAELPQERNPWVTGGSRREPPSW